MTEKELRKLKRSDFLQLLLTQGNDMSALQTRLDETTEELGQLQATNERLKAKLNEKDELIEKLNERLKAKLDEKDELIEKLKERLDNKDATISALQQEIEDIKASRRIELEKADSIAVAALSLNGVFEAAQKAADQYLYNIRFMHDELEAKLQAEKAKQEQAPKASKSDPMKRALTPKPKTEGTIHPTQKIGLFNRLRRRGTR